MRRVHAAVVTEHIALVVEHGLQVFLFEVHAGAVQPPGRAVGIIGEIVDERGDEHEEAETEENVFSKRFERAFLFTHKAEDPVQRPDHAEARPGVKTGPLARRAHAEEKTGEREVARPSLRRRGGERVPALREEPAVHEVIHRQREEHAVGVDRGDARLDKVHEIGGEQQRAADGNAAPSEEPPGKGVDERQHRHAEERPGKAPAEGRYAPNRHAKRNQQLAQRGMRDLIGVHAAHMLKSRARVVDLVKIA